MRDVGIISNRYATFGRDVTSAVKGFASQATPKETARMISSRLKGFETRADDGNELCRVIWRLTSTMTTARAPAAGKPGRA